MRDIAINTFQGGLNTDVDRRMTPEGDWIASKNIVNYHQGKDGVVKPLLGNAEIPLAPISLPDGTNQCIGSYEDEQTKSVIWFNYNSNNQHGIYRYWHEQFKVDQVQIWPNFDFDPSRKITGIAVVDGRYLIWTDVRATPTELSGQPLGTNAGNQTRCLDMEYATLIGGTFLANTGNAYKTLSYDIFIHWNTANISAIVNPILIYARTTNFDGTTSAVQQIASIPAQSIPDFENTKEGIYNQIALALEAFLPGSVAEDKRKYTSILVPPLPSGGRRLELFALEGGLESTNAVIFTAPTNHYHFPYIDEQFDFHKPMPLDHIDAKYGKSEEFNSDDSYGKHHQFQYRYIYYDNSRSAWGPFSVVPTNMEVDLLIGLQAIKSERDYSAIYLYLNDEKLSKEWVGYITGVEIAYRQSNNSQVVSIGKFRHWDINDIVYVLLDGSRIITRSWLKVFSGLELTTAIASDEVGSTGDTQVLKLFDWIPRRINGLTSVADETGTTRIIIGGETMGYENPIVKASVEVLQSPLADQTFPIGKPIENYIQENRKYFKKGGRYSLSITYYDEKGWTPGAVKIAEVKIPFQGGVNNFHYLRVNFDTPPPTWAVRWRITRSQNLNQVSYKQFACWRIQRIRFAGAMYTVEPDLNQATHYRILLSTSQVTEGILNIVELFNEAQSESTHTIWIPEPRDRLQIVGFMALNRLSDDPNDMGYYGEMRNNPFADSLDSNAFNLRIVGYQREYAPTPTSNDSESPITFLGQDHIRYFALVQVESHVFPFREPATLTEQFNAGCDQHTYIAEIYRPGTLQDQIIFETVAAGTVNYDGFDPIHMPSGDPQRIELRGGDTYYYSPLQYRLVWPVTVTAEDILARKYQNWHFEVPTQYQDNATVLTDAGRALAIDDNGKEEYNYQRIRISDAYTPSTRINGLSAFRGLNFIDINKNFGPIMALKNIRDDVAAICWNKIQPIYIGKGRMLQLDGQEQVGRSSSLMTLAAPLMEDWGTQNPESLVSTGRVVYGVDKRMGVVWRYSNDGLTPISYYKNMNKFKELLVASESSYTVGLFILGGYDPRLKMYFFSLTAHTLYADSRQPVQVAGRTFGFCETDNNWKDEFSFIPEMYGVGGIHLISFKSGAPWKHNQALDENLVAIPPCNFYGVQYVPELTYVVNKNPGTTKVWQNLRMQSKAKWEAIQITIPPNDKYPLGMLSRLKASNITNREGMFLADFLRDIYDPEYNTVISALLRGRVLRGEILIVSLQGELDNDLVRIDTEYFPSMKTN